jgi:opacity protein-like surface antigen
MKYSLLLAALLAMAGVAQADVVAPYAGVQYQYQAGRSGTADAQVGTFTVGNRFSSGFAAELVGESSDKKNTTQALTDKVELAAVASTTLGPVTGYARVAFGDDIVSGASAFPYYSVEPGVKLAVSSDTTVKLGYRLRNATDTDANHAFHTQTVRVGVEQSLTKALTLTAGADRSYGDSKYNSVQVGLVARF